MPPTCWKYVQTVEHDLPADTPGPQRGRLPVVFLEPDVVLAGVDPARFEAVQIELLNLVGRRLEDHLKLVVLEQAIRILAKAAVVGPPRRLDVGHAPRTRAEHAEQRFRVGRARADLEVERLLNQTAV
jgi:hypothetical protein